MFYFLICAIYREETAFAHPFKDLLQNRQRFALDEIYGHHSCTVVNMGSCALRLGRTLEFDPEKQLFVNDDQANLLINQPMRAPWASMML